MSLDDRIAVRGLLAGLALLGAGIAARLAPADYPVAPEPQIEVPRSDVCNSDRVRGCIVLPLTVAKIVRYYRLPPGVEDRLTVDGSGRIQFAGDPVQAGPSKVTRVVPPR